MNRKPNFPQGEISRLFKKVSLNLNPDLRIRISFLGRALPPPNPRSEINGIEEAMERLCSPAKKSLGFQDAYSWARELSAKKKGNYPTLHFDISRSSCYENNRANGGQSEVLRWIVDNCEPNIIPKVAEEEFFQNRPRIIRKIIDYNLEILKPFIEHAWECDSETCEEGEKHLPACLTAIPEAGFKWRVPSLLPQPLLWMATWVRRIFNFVIKDDTRIKDVFKGTQVQQDKIMKYWESFETIHSGDLKNATDNLPFDYIQGLALGILEGYQGPLEGWEKDIAMLSLSGFRMTKVHEPLKGDRQKYLTEIRDKMTQKEIRNATEIEPIKFSSKIVAMFYNNSKSTPKWATDREQYLTNEDITLRTMTMEELRKKRFVEMDRRGFREKLMEEHRELLISSEGRISRKGVHMSNPLSFQILNLSQLYLDSKANELTQTWSMTANYGDDILRGGPTVNIDKFRELTEMNNGEFSMSKDFQSEEGNSIFTENLFIRGNYVPVTKLKMLCCPKVHGELDRPIWYLPQPRNKWAQQELFYRFKPYWENCRKLGVDLNLPRELGGAGFTLIKCLDGINFISERHRRMISAIAKLPDDEFAIHLIRLRGSYRDIRAPVSRLAVSDILAQFTSLSKGFIRMKKTGEKNINELYEDYAQVMGGLRILSVKEMPENHWQVSPLRLARYVLNAFTVSDEAEVEPDKLLSRFQNLTICNPIVINLIKQTELLSRFSTAVATI